MKHGFVFPSMALVLMIWAAYSNLNQCCIHNNAHLTINNNYSLLNSSTAANNRVCCTSSLSTQPEESGDCRIRAMTHGPNLWQSISHVSHRSFVSIQSPWIWPRVWAPGRGSFFQSPLSSSCVVSELVHIAHQITTLINNNIVITLINNNIVISCRLWL